MAEALNIRSRSVDPNSKYGQVKLSAKNYYLRDNSPPNQVIPPSAGKLSAISASIPKSNRKFKRIKKPELETIQNYTSNKPLEDPYLTR